MLMMRRELLSAIFLRTGSCPSSEPMAQPPMCMCIITPFTGTPGSGLRMRQGIVRLISRDGIEKLSALSSSVGCGMDVRPALIIWRYLVALTYQIVSKLLRSQGAGQELNYFMQMYASSCSIHQDFVEGRCLCRYSRWQKFGDIECNIT